MFKNPQNQSYFTTIVECFCCADGGYCLIKLREFLQELESKADPSSQSLMHIFASFARMVEVANNRDLEIIESSQLEMF